MKMTNFWTVLAALAVTFTSCNKDENLPDDYISEETGSVKLRLSQPAGTRAEGTAVNDNAPISLGEGYLYFASATSVTKVVKLVSTASDPTKNPVEVNVGNISSATGEIITDVPSNSTKIYVLSNLPTAYYPTSVATPNATLEAVALQVEDLYDYDLSSNPLGGVSAVPLYGVGTIEDPLTPGDNYTADITVDAVAARMEIGKLTGTGAIQSFELAGIYINNIYTKMAVNGTIDATTITNNGSDAENYGGTTDWYVSPYDVLSDVYSPATPDVTLEIEPAGGKVWAYQFFPVNDTQEIPHVVIELANVVVESAGVNVQVGTQYLTVKGFKDSTSADVDELKKGYVYKFNITFDETHIQTEPEVGLFNVEVTITVTPWKAETLTPVL